LREKGVKNLFLESSRKRKVLSFDALKREGKREKKEVPRKKMRGGNMLASFL